MKKDIENKIKKIAKSGKVVFLSGLTALTVSGCNHYKYEHEVSTNSNVQYAVIDTMDDDLVENGIQQTIDVPGEEFKLDINYKCILEQNSKWTVTSDKQIYMDVSTIGLKEGYKVFIDNVHIDASICSYFPVVDGIIQDSMDDRVHNAQMIGFPISNTITYSNIFGIEGQNETFIRGSIYGFNGLVSGSVNEERFVESDYLKRGVYANKISSVIDLIIINENEEVKCVSVPSIITVSVWPFIEHSVSTEDSTYSTYYYYYYDNSIGKMNYENISQKEYDEICNNGKSRVLK